MRSSRAGCSTTPAIRAAAAQQEAYGHALDGDETTCLAKLDEARSFVTNSRNPVGRPELASHCTPTYVQVQRATCWLALGKPACAVAAFDDALREWPEDYRRERGLHLARQAQALAAARQPDRAGAVGREALAIGREAGSGRIFAELYGLSSTLEPWLGKVVEVDEFIAELTVSK